MSGDSEPMCGNSSSSSRAERYPSRDGCAWQRRRALGRVLVAEALGQCGPHAAAQTCTLYEPIEYILDADVTFEGVQLQWEISGHVDVKPCEDRFLSSCGAWMHETAEQFTSRFMRVDPTGRSCVQAVSVYALEFQAIRLGVREILKSTCLAEIKHDEVNEDDCFAKLFKKKRTVEPIFDELIDLEGEMEKLLNSCPE